MRSFDYTATGAQPPSTPEAGVPRTPIDGAEKNTLGFRSG